MGSSFGEMFVKGGWVMWPLLVFSILTWAVVMERTWVFLTLKPRLTKLTNSILNSLRAGDPHAAKQLCHTEKPYVSEVFLGTLDTRRSREYAERVTERNRIKLMGHLKRNLWVLGTIGSASPFIGLLGTVLGIVRAFHEIQTKQASGISVVGAGISEALIATAAGLIVAIIALLTYNVFVTAANQTISGLKLTLGELLDHSFEKGLTEKSV